MKQINEMNLWDLNELIAWCDEKITNLKELNQDSKGYERVRAHAQAQIKIKTEQIILEQFWNNKGE